MPRAPGERLRRLQEQAPALVGRPALEHHAVRVAVGVEIEVLHAQEVAVAGAVGLGDDVTIVVGGVAGVGSASGRTHASIRMPLVWFQMGALPQST